MKATGIVRRIDDLGRVVIPKEIRRTMRIEEGDPLEIYTSNDGEVIFKKYSPIENIAHLASRFIESLYRALHMPVGICDRDVLVSLTGLSGKEFLGRRISNDLDQLVRAKKSYAYDGGDLFRPIEGTDITASICYPITSQGDLYGTICCFHRPNVPAAPVNGGQLVAVKAFADFLGNECEF